MIISYMNSYVYEFIYMNSYMNSYDFFIYEFICFMNSYMNSGVPRFQMNIEDNLHNHHRDGMRLGK